MDKLKKKTKSYVVKFLDTITKYKNNNNKKNYTY